MTQTQYPSRSTNLKLGLEYTDWELIENCLITVAKGLAYKDKRDEARAVSRLARNVGEITSALRAEGHV